MKPRKDLSAIVRAALPGILALVLVALSIAGCDLSSQTQDSGSVSDPTSATNTNPPATLTVPAPTVVFTSPVTNITAPAGQHVTISWSAYSTQKTVTSQLSYDKDGLKNTGDEHTPPLKTVSKIANDVAAATYDWDTSAVTPGVYHLFVIADDTVNAAVTVYCKYTVTVTDSTPKVTVTEPFSPVSVNPAENVVLKWTQYAPLAPSTVTLYYDNNMLQTDGYAGQIAVLPQTASSTGGSYTWNVPRIKAGSYYIVAELNYGKGMIYSYSPAPISINGPTVTLSNPASSKTWHGGGQVSISYQVSGAKSGTTITLFYELNGVQTNLITLPITSDAAASWTWTSDPLPAGTYRIGGKVVDGVNDPIIAYAPGTVTDTGPTFSITSPTTGITVHSLDTVPVTFAYQMNGGTASVKFYLDDDTNVTNGFATPALATVSGLLPSSTTGSATMTLPVLTVGKPYYIVGVFDNGTTQIPYYVGGGQQGGTPIVVVGPQLNLTGPTLVGKVPPGTIETITWSNTVPDSPTNPAYPTVWMFYTTNQADSSTYQNIIPKASSSPPGTNPNTLNKTYSWTIPSNLTGGPWYIGAILTDEDGNATDPTWAPCALTMLDRSTFVKDLGYVEGTKANGYADALGRTLRGVSPYGHLGGVTTHVPWKWVMDPKDPTGFRRQPGIDMNKDGYDDFIVTAPNGSPFYLERYRAGESYLMLSDPNILFKVPHVGDFEPVSVTATGSELLPGAIFSGPAELGTTNGIGAVALSRDADGDGIPDIVFGIPYVSKVYYEGQDYDPWDDFAYQQALKVANGVSLSESDFAVTYSDAYRAPAVSTWINPDSRVSDQTDWGNISAAMLVAVAGKIPALHAATTRPAGSSELQDIVIPLDLVGEPDSDIRPRVVHGTMADMQGPDGIRMYCPWWFRNLSPHYTAQTGGTFSNIQTPDDLSYFGDSVIEADLDGDGKPEWIANQPFDPTNAATASEGWLHVIWSNTSTLWNAKYDPTKAPGAWQNGGWVQINTVTITNTISATSTTTTTTSTTGSKIPAPAYTWGAWSWPYAFTVGDAVFTITTTITIDNTVTPSTTTTNTVVTPNDGRDRGYCWPVASDYIDGDTTVTKATSPATNPHLGALGNVGDFNGDDREDITVGAPQANPGGIANAGYSYLIFGQPAFGGARLVDIGNPSAPNPLAGMRVAGTMANEKVGTSQNSAGDFDGDGLSDWIIGAPGYTDVTAGAGCGRVGIVYGDRFLQGTFSFSDIGTAKLPGVIFVGESAGAAAGTWVCGVGDVDGDGFDDIVIIAPNQTFTVNGTARTGAGVAYLIYGGQNLTGTINLSEVGKSVQGVIYVGPHTGEGLGTVAPAGDVDGDGYADFLIGNPNYNVLNSSGGVQLQQVGQVYLIRGGPRVSP